MARLRVEPYVADKHLEQAKAIDFSDVSLVEMALANELLYGDTTLPIPDLIEKYLSEAPPESTYVLILDNKVIAIGGLSSPRLVGGGDSDGAYLIAPWMLGADLSTMDLSLRCEFLVMSKAMVDAWVNNLKPDQLLFNMNHDSPAVNKWLQYMGFEQLESSPITNFKLFKRGGS